LASTGLRCEFETAVTRKAHLFQPRSPITIRSARPSVVRLPKHWNVAAHQLVTVPHGRELPRPDRLSHGAAAWTLATDFEDRVLARFAAQRRAPPAVETSSTFAARVRDVTVRESTPLGCLDARSPPWTRVQRVLPGGFQRWGNKAATSRIRRSYSRPSRAAPPPFHSASAARRAQRVRDRGHARAHQRASANGRSGCAPSSSFDHDRAPMSIHGDEAQVRIVGQCHPCPKVADALRHDCDWDRRRCPVPGATHAIHVDAVEEHPELRGVKRDALGARSIRGSRNRPFLEALTSTRAVSVRARLRCAGSRRLEANPHLFQRAL
jgi:hypothetical protein